MQRVRRLNVHGIEQLPARMVLATLAGEFGGFCAADSWGTVEPGAAAEVEPQYRVNQSPRLQIGNAPLSGTPADTGWDQIEIVWQTVQAGEGTADEFVVQLRDAEDPTATWHVAPAIEQLVTGIQTRVVHSALFTELQWNHLYEYRVDHLRAGAVIGQYGAEFRTRLVAGDATPFTFAAYGDSAVPGAALAGFRSVQQAINNLDPAFAVLLGDNTYDSGSHADGDARFDPAQNPEATLWNASHIDYFAIGNHELFSGGQASLDNFSMPRPVAGVNAFVSPPDGEQSEFFGAFDYGDVHFVTVNSNAAELGRGDVRDAKLAALGDFLVANLAASNASWKVVFMHHPLVGSLKLRLYPDTNYLELMLPRLAKAGADLVLVGDSHTYAWTYPLQGINDVDGNQEIADNEVVFAGQSRTDFVKGSGVVQLIAGTGGRNLRNDPFGQPFMAQTHSLAAPNYPVEYGFAKIDVTRQELVVQYISAATGQIVGDENQNGVRDVGEEYFAEFRIVDDNPAVDPDVNTDGRVDDRDLDAVCAAIRGGDVSRKYDMNEDGVVSFADYEYFRGSVLQIAPGDANLDGRVNSSDLVMVFQAGRYEQPSHGAGWAEGDWNCDGLFTTQDLVTVFALGVYEAAAARAAN